MSEKLFPSKFLREHKPEYYSDTKDRTAYILDRDVFDHFLETITAKNKTHDFEIFCRKLCARVIAPNLRPQTGPDGGGDSKADTETYPVADEIAQVFIADVNTGKERWAFTFSANADWARKVRGDVQGLIATGRHYDRIHCVTSRNAKAKPRAALEQSLSEEFGVPITIHDRSWIVEEVVDKDNKDLAYNYLHVGSETDASDVLGVSDYSRSKQLADIEKSLLDSSLWIGQKRQRVTEAVLALKLSRNLERPRTETDGRAARAIRLAKSDGSERQIFEAEYEQISGAFWYFDDFLCLNDSYDAFADKALKSDHAPILQYLSGLHQLLVVAIVHGHLTQELCQFDRRSDDLIAALARAAAITSRPNNSLESEFMLLFVKHSRLAVDDRSGPFTDTWNGLKAVMDKAVGLSEFDFDRLATLVDVLGVSAGDDTEYDNLVERLADLVGERKGEGERAIILLNRAQKLDLSRHFDLIRMMGKAIVGLSKKEYRTRLVEAQHILMLAYRKAGLLWAARATGMSIAANLVIESESDEQLPIGFVPTMKNLAWTALMLGHIPDAIFAISTMWLVGRRLPFDDNSQALFDKESMDVQAAFACLFLTVPESELLKLVALPDSLDRLEIIIGRTALLYRLGYIDVLRADQSVPPEETEETAAAYMNILAGQPFAKAVRTPLVLNSDGQQTIWTRLLGIRFGLTHTGTETAILAAEAVVASLEAFFATTLQLKVAPHSDRFDIDLVEVDGIAAPTAGFDELHHRASISWPRGLSPATYEQQGEIIEFLIMFSGQAFAATCIFDDQHALIEKLFEDEGVHHRISTVASLPNMQNRICGRWVTRATNWKMSTDKVYLPQPGRPEIVPADISDPDDGPTEEQVGNLESHEDLEIKSAVDMPLWARGRWSSTAYAVWTAPRPPCMGLIFEDSSMVIKVFEGWRHRFGDQDQQEDIYISIVRDLPGWPKNDYIMFITSRIDDATQSGRIAVSAMQAKHMEPATAEYLNRFLEAYVKAGSFILAPAMVGGDGQIKLMPQLAIHKRKLRVLSACEVTECDPECIALRSLDIAAV